MTDAPLMCLDTPVRRLEVKAMEAYRSKYPTAPPWQELDHETRSMWVWFTEKTSPKAES